MAVAACSLSRFEAGPAHGANLVDRFDALLYSVSHSPDERPDCDAVDVQAVLGEFDCDSFVLGIVAAPVALDF